MSLVFLEDMTTLQPIAIAVEGSRATDQRSIAVRQRRTGCSRRRDRLQEAREEVASLQRQLEFIHENHELVEALDRLTDRSNSSDLQKWRFRAMRERSRKHDAKQRNVLLCQRLTANAKILVEVSDLVHKQMAKSVSFDRRFVRLTNDSALAFDGLQARLKARSSQLDTIFQQCDLIEVTTCVARTPRALSSSDGGISVAMSEAFVIPFHSAVVSDIASRVALQYGLEVLADNHMDKIVQGSESNQRQLRDQFSGGSESDRRMIFRRIEDARGTVLLWEGSSYWQISDSEIKHEAHDSGWALIAPAEADGNDISIVHYGGSMQIQATDAARLKANSVLVTGIVRAVQSHLKSRISHTENVLMDSNKLVAMVPR